MLKVLLRHKCAGVKLTHTAFEWVEMLPLPWPSAPSLHTFR